ncbi:MAG: VanZ family protein [Fimbriimonadaceae bacterium]|nr:MAG: VanZ family protein [Fimbriimonadaceae bacterium]
MAASQPAKKFNRRWLWLLPIWAAVIFFTSTTVITQRQLARFVASVIPGVTEDGFFEWWQTWWWVFVKGFHLVEFFILTIAAGWVFRKFKFRRWLVWAPLFGLLFAISDEWHQTFVPARGGRATDVLIDSIGICLAALLMFLRTKKAKAHPPEDTL